MNLIPAFAKMAGPHRTVYPRQFWLLFWGMMISTIGSSMVWPFLVVYVSGRLSLPLTAVASLITLSSGMSLLSSFIGGPVIDRFGRKWVMVGSLIANAAGYLLMSQANTFPAFAVIMALNGLVNPLYRIGADAMMADLIPAPQRPDAYSLLRMSNNLGISIGPAVGGFISAISYTIAFTFASAGLVIYGLLIAIFAVETLPEQKDSGGSKMQRPLGGYGLLFANRPYIGMIAAFALVQVCASLIWVLLAIYTKQNYGITESQYGWIPTTNALMVVLFQFGVTQVTKRHCPLLMLAVGALFYSIGNLSVAFGAGFWSFWASMVIMTIGELILVPTTSTYAANMAPADQRARYMSLLGLTWSLASGIGPVFGGVLSDQVGPRSIWYGGGLIGLAGLVGFILLEHRQRAQKVL